jgi:type VI secretion system protein ImpA
MALEFARMDPDQITRNVPVAEAVPGAWSNSADPTTAPSIAAPAAPELDAAVAQLCAPLGGEDACGPDLDLDGDSEYLNFFAAAEGVLPPSFFSAEDGKPFDRTSVDIVGQLEFLKPLLGRTRDLRLLTMRARLQILNRDLAGFAASVAAVALLLEGSWDQVHPRTSNGDLTTRSMAIAALDVPTVIFPLQYAPLFESRRIGAVTFRALMIASDEAKPRGGEQKLAVAAIIEARGDADPVSLAATRRHVATLRMAIEKIRNAFALHGASAGIDNLQALAVKIQTFIDPAALESSAPPPDDANTALESIGTEPGRDGAIFKAAGAPTSLAEAREALAAIADYYTRCEPSSPTLPLVRQAHQLIGKSFIEVISILVPSQLEKAAFQIGGDQVFELPVGKLPSAKTNGSVPATEEGQPEVSLRYHVETRAQATALLDQVQRYFRHSEPSSPVPMFCERARAFAERDFMAVLRDVLPKAALKNLGMDK